MQFESDFRFDMDDNFSLCSQAMSCPSTSTSFSSASSAYDPFTPNSRRSTPHELGIDFDSNCHAFNRSHSNTITSPPTSMAKYMFPIKMEQERSISYSEGTIPVTPLRRLNEMAPGYDHMLDINMATQNAMSSMAPSGPYAMYATQDQSAMASAYSLTDSEVQESSASWSCATESPMSLFPQKTQHQDMDTLDSLDLDRYAQSPMGRWYLQAPGSPDRLRSHRNMSGDELQCKSSDLHMAQIRQSRKASTSDKSDSSATVDVVRRAMCKCDYPGCNKAFRRNEHLKRHKQTFHGEGPNRFSCEFCGKDQFNRQDNLNNHRKLHARPNSRNRGVEFIPAAVPVIEHEERNRKRRAPPKAKSGGEKREDDY